MPKLASRLARRVLPRESYLCWELAHTNDLYRELVADAKRRHRTNSEEVQALLAEWSFEAGMLEEELEVIATRQLRRQAQRLRIPFLSSPYGSKELETEDWKRGHNLGEWYLKPSGYSKVRAAIRAEEKERREALLTWVVPLTGLIGAVTGLIAVVLTLIQ